MAVIMIHFFGWGENFMLSHVFTVKNTVLLCGTALLLSSCGLSHQFTDTPTGYAKHVATPLSNPHGTISEGEGSRVDVKSLQHWHGIARDIVAKLGAMARMKGKPIFLNHYSRQPLLDSNLDYALRDALSEAGYEIADTKERAYYILDFAVEHADVDNKEDSDLVELIASLKLDDLLVTEVSGMYRVPEIGEERWMGFGWVDKLKPLPSGQINE